MQVTNVTFPIAEGNVNTGPEFHRYFEGFKFPDGRTGRWWIENRVNALLRQGGEYWDLIRRNGQWTYLIAALKGMIAGTMPRWNANRLLITLFDPEKHLHKSRAPTPPCLVTLDFKPVRDQLTLIATWRSQYTDTKGYGNLYSLALLLLQVSEMSGFKPGELYSVANKPILRWSPRKVGRSLLEGALK